MSRLEKCIFCRNDLEDYEYGHIVDNRERANTSNKSGHHNLSICKECAKELKMILAADQDAKGRWD